jgi:hypothetical protein
MRQWKQLKNSDITTSIKWTAEFHGAIIIVILKFIKVWRREIVAD